MSKQTRTLGGREFETYSQSATNTGDRFFFDVFDSYEELQQVREDVQNELIANNFQWSARTDYIENGGTATPELSFEGTTDRNLLQNPETISTILTNNEYQQALQELSAISQNIPLGASSQKAKLTMTEKPIGVFNYAAASTGLYRKQEYFSPDENRVVDATEVYGKMPNFYYVKEGKNIPLELRQEGTTEMLRINPNAISKVAGNGMVYTDPIRFGNHSLKFATTTKKVYLVRDEVKDVSKKGQEKYVDIYITNVINYGIRPENLMYRALSSIIVAQILEKAGYKVRINKVTAIRGANASSVYSVPVKDYGKPLDIQRIGIQLGDPRIFRWADLKDLSTLISGVMNTNLNSYGSIISNNSNPDYDTVMKNYFQWIGKKSKEGGKKLFNKNLKLHLSGSIDPSNDPYDVQMERVTAKVKDILDKVAIEFSGVRVALEEALKRDLPTKSKQQILTDFEASLRNTAPIRPADPDLRFYSDAEHQKEMDLFNKRLDEFNQLKTTI
jgi:hypothetical protein